MQVRSFCIEKKRCNSQLSVIISVWRPLEKIIGQDTFNYQRTFTYSIANIVPDTATQFLVYATTWCGNTKEPITFIDIPIYVTVDGRRLSKYLFIIGYLQDAYNTNTDNMWFPVPSDKIINVEVPQSVPGICKFKLTAIGYC